MHRAKHGSLKEHLQFLVLGFASLWEGLVIVLSLGFLSTEIRGYVLFELFEED